jgi:hypothetical protein
MRSFLHSLALRWLSRRPDVAVVDALRAQLAESKEREAYWRERCERLIDDALARTRGLSGPVMVESPAAKHERAVGALLGGMAITEVPRLSEDTMQ